MLEEAFADYELNANDLDEDECLLLLFCGVYAGEGRGQFGWVSIQELSATNAGPGIEYLPDSHFVQDSDRDGWKEFGVPDRPGFTYSLNNSGAIQIARRHERRGP